MLVNEGDSCKKKKKRCDDENFATHFHLFDFFVFNCTLTTHLSFTISSSTSRRTTMTISNKYVFINIFIFFSVVYGICPETTNTSTDVNDMVTGQPVTSTWLEGGFTSIGDQEWVLVSSSSSSFVEASVFVSLPNTAGEWANESFPAIARVRNVVTSNGVVSFETRLYQANDSLCSKEWHVPEPISPLSLSWMIAEHGAFNVSGNFFMVGKDNVTKTDDSTSNVNFPRIDFPRGCGGSTTICAYPDGTTVGVTLQLQTLVNDRLLVPRCKVVGLRFFRAGLQNHEATNASYYSMPNPETLSFMSFATGITMSCVEKMTFETVYYSDLSSTKQSFDFTYSYDVIPAVYGTVQTFTGTEFVAIRPLDRTLMGMNLLLQEDQCVSEETDHIAEKVAVLTVGEQNGVSSCFLCKAVFSAETFSPTWSPTLVPTTAPSAVPSTVPTCVPTAGPTSVPTSNPTSLPTTAIPTVHPTVLPTAFPTVVPSESPTTTPTVLPTDAPTALPSTNPTNTPTSNPTFIPTATPTLSPTISHCPSSMPSFVPTVTPSASPSTPVPTSNPTAVPTVAPTSVPSATPTSDPTMHPTSNPTPLPTSTPTLSPTFTACPATTNTSTDVNDMVTGQPVTSTWLEGGFTSIGDQEWVLVSSSSSSFVEASVFVSLPNTAGEWANESFPAIARVRNVVTSNGVVSFETRLYQANDSLCSKEWHVPEPISPLSLSWMIAEHGAFNVSGNFFMVGKDNVTKTDDSTSNVNFPRIDFPRGCGGSTTICAYPDGTTVGVTLQLQTLVNDRLLVPRCKIVGLRFFRAGLQNHEATNASYYSMPNPETLSFMSFATGITMSCVEKMTFETGYYSDLSSTKQSFDFTYSYDVIPAVYGTVQTFTGTEFVAIRPLDRTLMGMNLLLQEDQCVSEEMVHDVESVSVLTVGEQLDARTCLLCKVVFSPETFSPTWSPSPLPTSAPIFPPSSTPTSLPSVDTFSPTKLFSDSPTQLPIGCPTSGPSHSPSIVTSTPTAKPSHNPSLSPTSPSSSPTSTPTIAPCPPTTNTSTDVNDMVTGQPVTSTWLEGGFTSIGDQEWVLVSSSSSSFVEASVFVSLPNTAGEWANESFPAIARVRNVVTSNGVVSFETRLYQANDSLCSKEWHVPEPISPLSLSWMIAEHGAFNVSGNFFMVGKDNVTKTDDSTSNVNFPRIDFPRGCGGSTTICAYPDGTTVGVTLQLQTLVNDRLLVPRCKVVGLRFFRAGLQNHEATNASYYSMPNPETLSFMSFATGITMSCVEKMTFETVYYSDLSSTKQSFDFTYSYDVIPAVYGTVQTFTGTEFVAIRPLDRTLMGMNLLLQEDQCVSEEMVHDVESVSVLTVGEQLDARTCLLCKVVFSPETFSPTWSPTLVPTTVPSSMPTAFPTTMPSIEPTAVPTVFPTTTPSSSPTASPSSCPTSIPSTNPTVIPTTFPTVFPTTIPTYIPTSRPTTIPSSTPTVLPTDAPTALPSTNPTNAPTSNPTFIPTATPTLSPTISHCPSSMPSFAPTVTPSASPSTPVPTSNPTAVPTVAPTSVPSATPTSDPTMHPTSNPTPLPTSTPTLSPTFTACPATTNTSTDVNDMVTGQPVTSTWLEGGFTSIGDQEWVLVSSSSSSFVEASVFVSLPNTAGEWANESFPAIARVRNVVTSNGVVSFETRLYQANDSLCSKEWHVPEPISPLSLSWMIAEHGAFNVSGNFFMVGKDNVTKTDDSTSNVNFPRIDFPRGCGGSTTICAYPDGTTVGVTLQLQTLVNDRLLVPRCKVVGLRFFRAGLQNHEATNASYYSMPNPETLSFMSFATGITMSCVEKMTFETVYYSDLSSTKQSFDFTYSYDVIPAVYGTVQTFTGTEFVAIRPLDRTLMGMNLLLQEDQCVSEETDHIGEMVAVLTVGEQLSARSCLVCKVVFSPETFSPTWSPTLVPTAVPSVSPSSRPTTFPTMNPTSTPSSLPSSAPTLVPTLNPTTIPTSDPTAFPTVTPTSNPTAVPTELPTATPSVSPSSLPTAIPTTLPSGTPSVTPTALPTVVPTLNPTFVPSFLPTEIPTVIPSISPTEIPTTLPTSFPTVSPTCSPTTLPSVQPTALPTDVPSHAPTAVPTMSPTVDPTREPTVHPTALPTCAPSAEPTALPTSITSFPTETPSVSPSNSPTSKPSCHPSSIPSATPTDLPTNLPSDVPTGAPSAVPTCVPTNVPTSVPTHVPSEVPTAVPSEVPTVVPTRVPTTVPTVDPTRVPSEVPTTVPTAVPTCVPTAVPTCLPSDVPTPEPSLTPSHVLATSEPSEVPTASVSTTAPTRVPSFIDTGAPSVAPTTAARLPTAVPSPSPTWAPATVQPSALTTPIPTDMPTMSPSVIPTSQPTTFPSFPPTRVPTTVPITPATISPSGQNSTQSESPSSLPSSPVKQTLSPTSLIVAGSPSCVPSLRPTPEPVLATAVPTTLSTPVIPFVPQLGAASVSSVTSTEVTIRVNVSSSQHGGVVFCGAFDSPIQFSSINDIKAQESFRVVDTMSTSILVVISGLDALSEYHAYCFAENTLGYAESYFRTFDNGVDFKSACCKLVKHTTLWPDTIPTNFGTTVTNFDFIDQVFDFHLSGEPGYEVNVSVVFYDDVALSSIRHDVFSSVGAFSFSSNSTILSGSFLVNGPVGTYYISLEFSGSSAHEYDDASIHVLNIVDTSSNVPPPSLSSAHFDPSGLKLIVTFSTRTNFAVDVVGGKAVWPCDLLLSFNGAVGASCRWTSSSGIVAVLNDYSISEPSLNVGDRVVLLDGVLKTFCYSDPCDAQFASSAAVNASAPSEIILPTAIIKAPSAITHCDNLHLDPTQSTGNAGKEWASVSWTVTAADGSDTAAILALLERYTNTSEVIVIDSNLLAKTTYTIGLGLTNFLQDSTAEAVFTSIQTSVVSEDASLFLQISGPRYESRTRSSVLVRTASSSLKVCADGTLTIVGHTLSYSWTVYEINSTSDNLSVVPIQSVSSNPSVFRARPLTFNLGSTYKN